MVPLLLIYCFFVLAIVCWGPGFVFFWYALLCVLSSFAIILKRKRGLFCFAFVSYGHLVTVYVLWLFLTVPWVGLQCVIMVLPDHIHLLIVTSKYHT